MGHATIKSYTRATGYAGGINGLISQNYTENSTLKVDYYQYDDLGSTSNLTTSSGNASTTYEYDAYGNSLTTNPDSNRYLFSTKEFDVRSGLYYFGARYYDPEIGRWLTQDPLGFGGKQLNLYVYVHNNPANMVDPDGEIAQFAIAVAGAAIGGAVEAAKYFQAYQSGRISGAQYAGLIGVGATTGVISSFGSGYLGGALFGGVGSALNNVAEQKIIKGNINHADVGLSFGTGAVIGLFGSAGTKLGRNIIKYPKLNELTVGGSPIINYGAAGGLFGSAVATIFSDSITFENSTNWAGKEKRN